MRRPDRHGVRVRSRRYDDYDDYHDYDEPRPRRRNKQMRRGPNAGLVVGLILGFVFLIVGVVGIVIWVNLSKGVIDDEQRARATERRERVEKLKRKEKESKEKIKSRLYGNWKATVPERRGMKLYLKITPSRLELTGTDPEFGRATEVFSWELARSTDTTIVIYITSKRNNQNTTWKFVFDGPDKMTGTTVGTPNLPPRVYRRMPG